MPESPKPQQDNKLHQFRDSQSPEPAGELPFRNEVVGSPPFHAVGVDALSPLLASVRFPIEKRDLVARVGHARIPTSRNGTRLISELLERAVPRSFASAEDVVRAVERVLGEFESGGGGSAQWARSERG